MSSSGSYSGPFDLDWVRERLADRRVEWYESIDSTMFAAAKLAREGCAHGTIVGADQQTAGIGRHGHSWHSEPGAGLYVSFVLRLPFGPERLPLMTLALGLAANQAVEKLSALSPDLRWPNDVLIEGKKCAGILAQTEGNAIVAGVGINVRHDSFPSDLVGLATSLWLQGSLAFSNEELLWILAREIDEHLEILVNDGPRAILDMFTRSSSYVMSRRVKVDQPGGIVEGVTCGLDASGFLLVRQDNGVVATILAGGVRPA